MRRPDLESHLQMHLHRGDIRAALCYLEELYLRHPDIARALQLAQLYRQCRAFQAAIAHLQAALGLWPDTPEILRPLAEISMLGKQYQAAAAYWLALAQYDKGANLHAILRAIACYRQIGDETRAVALLNQHDALFQQKYPVAAIRLIALGRAGAPKLPAGLCLVTGNNGAGKTRAGHFLQMLGYRIVDADIEIASFCRDGVYSDIRFDLTQGDKTCAAQTHWRWPRDRFDTIRNSIEHEGFIIGGHGAIVREYIAECRQVFHLHAPTEVIAQRLRQRNSASHRIGSKGYEAALRRNTRESLPAYQATLLRSDRPVWRICAELLAAAHRNAGA